MKKFAIAASAALVATLAAVPASAAAVVVHDISVQRPIWVQLMGMLGL